MSKRNSVSFDPSSLINTQSAKNAMFNNPQEINSRRKKIHYESLIPNKNNHYSIENIEELADSIENFGLLQDLLVKQDNDKYIIISGHRRYEAIKLLVGQRGLEKFEYIDCCLNEDNEDEIVTEIKLHISNVLTRELSEYEKMIAVQELRALVLKAKENGFTIKGRMRDFIGDQINLGPAQTQKYLKLIDKGSDQIKEELRDKKISLSTALEMIDQPEPVNNNEPDDSSSINDLKDLIEKSNSAPNESKREPREYGSRMKIPKQTLADINTDLIKLKEKCMIVENPYLTRIFNMLEKHFGNMEEI
jgi:ParB family chromosome partitioning protein